MNNPFARSLSLRLLAIFAATAFLLGASVAALFTSGLSNQWQRSIRPHLEQYVRYVQRDLGSPPDPARADELARLLPVTIAIYRNGRFVHATDGRALDVDALRFRRLPSRGRGDAEAPRPIRAAIARERAREGTVLRVERGADTVYYRLEPPGRGRARGDGLTWVLLAVTLVLLGSYLVIRRQLAPIREVQRGVRRMSEGEFGHRIALGGRDDLAELGRSIDEMAARIGDMLDAKRQLLLAISHELRSPLARARVATELLPESRQRERLEEDLADMARLIEDLTESERLRTPHAALHLERLDPASLVTEALAPHGLAPVIEDGAPRSIVADAARLRLMVRNLVANALRHGRSGNGEARVTVTLSSVGDDVRIVVADRGPGIAPEHLEAVTEAFHRPDPSRARTSGGIGLGLFLARLAVEAHGGTLRVESDPAREPGTRVAATWPVETSSAHR